jgi:glycosyltransferase involved in cell wall biosynthesis
LLRPKVNIVQLTPGAGAMYCGGCLRDNALVAALRKLGHQALMVPLYLPLTLDEQDQSADAPVFFGGISVYLQQKAAFFRSAPGWLRDVFASRRLLTWAAGKAAKTRPTELGELTLSMLRGEEGNQARELEALIAWLKTQPQTDVVSLSNALLVGMARRLKAELRVPIACALQGEDWFLDSLPESHRAACWQMLAERAAEVDRFVAPSRYFGDLMRERLGLAADRVQVVPNGINLEGYAAEGQKPDGQKADGRWQMADGKEDRPPTLGFFARMCPEKGLDTLVEAYVRLRQRGRVGQLKLRVGGSCGPADAAFVETLRGRLQANGLLGDVEFHPNLDRAAKLEFLRSLTVFSVPASYGEAFGLYIIEALAAGVPVVQPRTAAFPELIEATGGGVLCAAGGAQALAEAVEELLLNPEKARGLGKAGQSVVFQRFSAEAMARATLQAYAGLTGQAD